MIRLENVSPENWRFELAVSEEQRSFVSDRAGILARAYAYRGSRSMAYIIYDDDIPVGMAMYYDMDDLGAYNFSQFFIDRRYQGRGRGYLSARQIIQLMRDDGKFDKVVLCFVDGDTAAMRLYEKLGFRLTGETDGNEIIMEMSL